MDLPRFEISPGLVLVPYGLHIEEIDALAVADLHIGYEETLLESGIHLPRSQYDKMKGRILGLLDHLKPKRLIINGDVKHEFGGATRQEWREVLDLLGALAGVVELHVVRGNHDNYLIPILKRMAVPFHDPYLETGDYLFIHGHKPMPKSLAKAKKALVLGHEHPAIAFRDAVGAKAKFKCHLVGEVEGTRLVVLPAISPLAPGTDVNLQPKPFSPALKGLDIESFRAIVVDDEVGAYDFGPIRGLKAIRRDEQGQGRDQIRSSTG